MFERTLVRSRALGLALGLALVADAGCSGSAGHPAFPGMKRQAQPGLPAPGPPQPRREHHADPNTPPPDGGSTILTEPRGLHDPQETAQKRLSAAHGCPTIPLRRRTPALTAPRSTPAAGPTLELEFRGPNTYRVGQEAALTLVARNELPVGHSLPVYVTLRHPDGSLQRTAMSLASERRSVFQGCDPTPENPNICDGHRDPVVESIFREARVRFLNLRGSIDTFARPGTYTALVESPDGRARAAPFTITVRGDLVSPLLKRPCVGTYTLEERILRRVHARPQKKGRRHTATGRVGIFYDRSDDPVKIQKRVEVMVIEERSPAHAQALAPHYGWVHPSQKPTNELGPGVSGTHQPTGGHGSFAARWSSGVYIVVVRGSNAPAADVRDFVHQYRDEYPPP